MGSTFEVQGWQRFLAGYRYMPVWSGDSIIMALFQLWKAKRSGEYGCVKLEWR